MGWIAFHSSPPPERAAQCSNHGLEMYKTYSQHVFCRESTSPDVRLASACSQSPLRGSPRTSMVASSSGRIGFKSTKCGLHGRNYLCSAVEAARCYVCRGREG